MRWSSEYRPRMHRNLTVAQPLLKHELPKLHAVTCPSNREGFRTASGAPGCPNFLPVRWCMLPHFGQTMRGDYFSILTPRQNAT
jgi:hypothetical protein